MHLRSFIQTIRMIHGYKRNKHQKSPQEEEQEQQMIEKINTKLGEFFDLPRNNPHPQNIPKYLQFISLLMQLVSDIPTVFNFRRELIKKLTSKQSPQELGKTLGNEIRLTTKLIQSDPKSYTIWTYRQWLVRWLFSMQPAVVAAEKELTKALLIKDEKNFHVWNYRNWLNSLHCDTISELAFTEQKIKSNPFNFSPYHFRTKLLQLHSENLLKDQSLKEEERRDILTLGMPRSQFQIELERVRTAVFLNPNQEAPWLYYHWLLGQLLPAFVILKTPTPKGTIITTNIKVSSFQELLTQGKISSTSKYQSNEWLLEDTQEEKVLSNLEKPGKVRLQSTGLLFLGDEATKEWMEKNVQSVYKKQLKFINEVIESEEEGTCRFGHLQKATIYRWLIESGCGPKQFDEWVQEGLSSVNAVKDESKGTKYIKKQLQYWQRLSKGELSILENALKTIFC